MAATSRRVGLTTAWVLPRTTGLAVSVIASVVLVSTVAGSQESPTPAGPACEAADILRETGQTKAAVRDYMAIIRADSSSECARIGLLEIAGAAAPAAPVDSCAVAEELIGAGSKATAKAILEEAIKKDSNPCSSEHSASRLLSAICPWPASGGWGPLPGVAWAGSGITSATPSVALWGSYAWGCAFTIRPSVVS